MRDSTLIDDDNTTALNCWRFDLRMTGSSQLGFALGDFLLSLTGWEVAHSDSALYFYEPANSWAWQSSPWPPPAWRCPPPPWPGPAQGQSSEAEQPSSCDSCEVWAVWESGPNCVTQLRCLRCRLSSPSRPMSLSICVMCDVHNVQCGIVAPCTTYIHVILYVYNNCNVLS